MDIDTQLKPGPVFVKYKNNELKLAWFTYHAQSLLSCNRDMVVLYFGRSYDDFHRIRKSRIIPLNAHESLFYKQLDQVVDATNKFKKELTDYYENLYH